MNPVTSMEAIASLQEYVVGEDWVLVFLQVFSLNYHVSLLAGIRRWSKVVSIIPWFWGEDWERKRQVSLYCWLFELHNGDEAVRTSEQTEVLHALLQCTAGAASRISCFGNSAHFHVVKEGGRSTTAATYISPVQPHFERNLNIWKVKLTEAFWERLLHQRFPLCYH